MAPQHMGRLARSFLTAVLTRVVAGGLAALAVTSLASAQNAPRVDPAFESAKAKFEALAEGERKAIQRDLVWVGGFAGGATGEFGPLTYGAIRRFRQAAKQPVDGELTPPQRALLARLAETARTAAGFTIETDAASGMRIGVPRKLLEKRSQNSGGHDRWQDGAEKVTLDLQILKPDDELPVLFEKGIDPKVRGRKITYKLLRPDFLVISGETAGGKFYRRIEKVSAGPLRGFSIGYDKAMAKLVDPLVIAIASTFEPFPIKAAPTGTEAGKSAIAPPEPVRIPRLTGIVIAPGRILTSAAAIKACKALEVDGAKPIPARIEKQDAVLGLAVLTTAHSGAPVLAPTGTVESSRPAMLLQRDRDGALLGASAEGAAGLIRAPVQEGGAGAALFDAEGRWIGLILADPAPKYALAGVQPVLRHKVVDAAAIARFAGLVPSAANAGSEPAISLGALAAKAGPSLVSILCRQ